MGVVQREIIISARPEEVFAYIADLSRHPEWAQHKIAIKQTSQGEVKVGATFTSGHVGKAPKDNVTITDIVPNSRFAYEAQGPEGHDRWSFEVYPEGSSTRLVKGFENLSLPFWMKPVTPLLPRMAAGTLEKDLRRIKDRLEAGAG
jgi:uncharacterized protein YndB with AHSA1/START domain